jgi:large subunit ribosomal protein L19e
MSLQSQRRIAADILKVGESRVWIDPTKIELVAKAMTREDIRRLIREGIIRAIPKKGISHARYRMRKGKRRGPGRRKGGKWAIVSRKRMWMMKIRALRRFLRRLKERGIISRQVYRKLYRMAKGGAFQSKAHLAHYIKERGLRQSHG